MTKKLFFIPILFSISVFLTLTSCKKDFEYTFLQGNALGTTFSIKYNNTLNYTEAIDSIFSVINNSLSTYHPNSLISKINRGDTTQITDEHFEKVFYKARKIYFETEGSFDPTIGTLVNAWGFGPEKSTKGLDSTAVEKYMELVGYEKLSLKNHRITKANPSIYLDFNAIAKGYAVDVIGLFLESKQIENYMIEIGGEMRVRGTNPKGTLWKVGVEKPLTDGTRALEATVDLDNQSMATSGNYRKFWIDDNGEKYVHTINPKTGYPEQNDLLSVSVISKLDSADVDAYATAFMVMGYQKTKEFLEGHQKLEAVLIYLDVDGKTQIFSTIPLN